MVNKNKVGLVFGALLGGWHLAWSVLVFLGVAQSLYDFIMWAHMIHVSVTIGPFEFGTAVTLIIITGIIGYVLGYIGAWVWNKVHFG